MGLTNHLLTGMILQVTYPGLITERQAFAGFASPGVAAYAALFILSEAFAEVKVLDAAMLLRFPRQGKHGGG